VRGAEETGEGDELWALLGGSIRSLVVGRKKKKEDVLRIMTFIGGDENLYDKDERI